MGDCRYCGKPAGVFRKEHKACADAHQKHQNMVSVGKQQMVDLIADSVIKPNLKLSELATQLAKIGTDYGVPSSERERVFSLGWAAGVDRCLDDNILDESEELRLTEIKDYFRLSESLLDTNGALTKTVKAAVLRDILSGQIPTRFNVSGSLPFNFQKSESLLWAFPDTRYLEDKTKRTYVGASHGVSIRVAKGLYYRVGAFKGQPVDKTERVHIATGWMAVTTKNIYFAGSEKSVRIPYAKVVSFNPYSDGIGLMRDAASAKPQFFVNGDGWFTYNLVSNISQL